MLVTLIFIIGIVWLFAMFFGAFLGGVAAFGSKLLDIIGYNAWWERMKIERSPENMAKKAAQKK